jgi:hypothetical protein
VLNPSNLPWRQTLNFLRNHMGFIQPHAANTWCGSGYPKNMIATDRYWNDTCHPLSGVPMSWNFDTSICWTLKVFEPLVYGCQFQTVKSPHCCNFLKISFNKPWSRSHPFVGFPHFKQLFWGIHHVQSNIQISSNIISSWFYIPFRIPQTMCFLPWFNLPASWVPFLLLLSHKNCSWLNPVP